MERDAPRSAKEKLDEAESHRVRRHCLTLFQPVLVQRDHLFDFSRPFRQENPHVSFAARGPDAPNALAEGQKVTVVKEVFPGGISLPFNRLFRLPEKQDPLRWGETDQELFL
jgi:hypothetical protein